MARALRKVAEFLGPDGEGGDGMGGGVDGEEVAWLKRQEDAILRNLDDLHWVEKEGVYCDSTVDQFEEDEKVCHKGYVSLFPFMLGLMDGKAEKVGRLLDVISDPEELWSDYGIRSLSKRSEHYGTGENYWRSPVWMNINYLILQRLLELAQNKGPHQDRAKKIYSSLRKNLVKTVSNSWDKTGFAWEQYNPETGEGQRTQHFTGWTSLAVKMMAMPNLEEHVIDEL